MHKKLVLILIPLLFISYFAFSRLTFGAVKNLNIGVIGPQGLPHWSPGGMWDAAQLAAMEINAAGGISIGTDTYMINLMPANEHSYPTVSESDAILSITDLIGSGAKLIIGGFRTEVTAPMLTVIRSAQVPFFIDGAATSWLVNLSTPAKYASDKYIFRAMPTNDSVLLPVIVNYLRYYLLPDKLNKMYGQDLDNNPATPNQTRIAVITEKLGWADTMHYVFTTLYGLPYLAPGVPNPYYLGPYANVTYAGRIDPYTVTDTTPYLDGAEAAGCRLMIIIFSAPVGQTLIKQWAEGEYPMLPVGINVMAQLQSHWDTTAEGCEYEVTMSTTGTRTVIVPGISDVFWDNFVGNYTVWPIYTAWGAYNALYAMKATLSNINASDIAAVQSYFDGPSPPNPGASDVLIPYFEKTDITLSTGRFVYTSGIYGPGTGHDIFAIELNLTNVLGYPRGLMCQWLSGGSGILTVVSPRDQSYSRKTLIPLWMYPLATWDVDYNGKIDMLDLWYAAKSFGANPGNPRWDIEADVNADGKNDMVDLWEVARNFGKVQTPWPLP